MLWFIKTKRHIVYHKGNSPMQIHGAILNKIFLSGLIYVVSSLNYYIVIIGLDWFRKASKKLRTDEKEMVCS